MEKPVDFGQLKIDPAPFQLPEKSSLLKVHSLFSMLGKQMTDHYTYSCCCVSRISLNSGSRSLFKCHESKSKIRQNVNYIWFSTWKDLNVY